MFALDEYKTIEIMIKLYCKKNHGKYNLCLNCDSLLKYSKLKLLECPLNPKKPVCSKCKIHCYKGSMRNEIKKVMRYSGPRMLFLHPVIGIKFFFKTIFS